MRWSEVPARASVQRMRATRPAVNVYVTMAITKRMAGTDHSVHSGRPLARRTHTVVLTGVSATLAMGQQEVLIRTAILDQSANLQLVQIKYLQVGMRT